MEPSRPHGREEVVAAVLEAARLLIAERGPSGVSLREIAAAANVNNGLVFQYVGTKGDLVAEVYRSSSTRAKSRLSRAMSFDEALEIFVGDPIDSDLRLMVWAALESDQPPSLFGEPRGAEALGQIISNNAASSGLEVSDLEVRLATSLAAMVLTAWRVLGPVARLSGGIGANEASLFDEAALRIIRLILEFALITASVDRGQDSTGPKPRSTDLSL